MTLKWINYLRAETEAFSLATHVIRDWLWGHERCSQIFHPLIGKCEFVLGIDLLEFQFPHQQMEHVGQHPTESAWLTLPLGAAGSIVQRWYRACGILMLMTGGAGSRGLWQDPWLVPFTTTILWHWSVPNLRWHTGKTEQYSQPVKYSIKWDLVSNFYSYRLLTCFLVSFSKMS